MILQPALLGYEGDLDVRLEIWSNTPRTDTRTKSSHSSPVSSPVLFSLSLSLSLHKARLSGLGGEWALWFPQALSLLLMQRLLFAALVSLFSGVSRLSTDFHAYVCAASRILEISRLHSLLERSHPRTWLLRRIFPLS